MLAVCCNHLLVAISCWLFALSCPCSVAQESSERVSLRDAPTPHATRVQHGAPSLRYCYGPKHVVHEFANNSAAGAASLDDPGGC